MIKDQQLKLYQQNRAKGRTQEAAAAAAGMTAKTARKWEVSLLLPSEAKPSRTWRTREDDFASVWEALIVPLLKDDEEGILDSTALFEWLQTQCPGEYPDAKLRTMQRRVRDWRALEGPGKEVVFPQQHVPGRRCQVDFTPANELGVTIGGEVFPHMFFECILCFSGRRHVDLARSETFEALFTGMQRAFQSFGGVPLEAQTDRMSAATHQLKDEDRFELTERYRQFLEHYDVNGRFIETGKPNQNGCVERGHGVFKRAMKNALKLRGSKDFDSLNDYIKLVREVEGKLNGKRDRLFQEETPHLRPLPAPVPCYTEIEASVRKWSCIQVKGNTYSVPSRLIGHDVKVRIYPDLLEVWYNGKAIEQLPRLVGNGRHAINYRHIIHSLVRKPGAFACYRYREELFPSLVFRKAYDHFVEHRGTRGDVEYLRVLYNAATTLEVEVAAALTLLLDLGKPFCSKDVEDLVDLTPRPPTKTVPPMTPKLNAYDNLLSEELNEQLALAS